jgi:hypothetical protein
MIFGNEGLLTYAAQNYAALKGVFDQMQLRDRHTLSIKEGN